MVLINIEIAVERYEIRDLYSVAEGSCVCLLVARVCISYDQEGRMTEDGVILLLFVVVMN
jgi:hypothetical protein